VLALYVKQAEEIIDEKLANAPDASLIQVLLLDTAYLTPITPRKNSASAI